MRPYRKERVANTIRDIVSGVIDHKLQDPRLSALTTVTRVAVSGDLTFAKVYLSVQGDDAAARLTLAAIQHAGGYIQREVARGLTVRQCPELRFAIDKSVKGVLETMALLEENRRNHPEWSEQETSPDETSSDDGEGDNDADSVQPREGSK